MGKQWKQWETLFFGAPKSLQMVTATMKLRQAMTNLDNILKSKNITLPTKICLVKAMVFPKVMYRCESWTIKKAERRRIDAFELWCWRRLLRFPWTERGSNQSILKEISPEYSLERRMLKLKLQYFGHLLQRSDSLENTLMLGKIEGRRREWQRLKWLDDINNLMDMSLSKLWELVMYMEAWHTAIHGVTNSQKWLSNWTGLILNLLQEILFFTQFPSLGKDGTFFSPQPALTLILLTRIRTIKWWTIDRFIT